MLLEDDEGAALARTADSPSRPRLFLVPVVPIPPSANASTRMLLSLGLQEAVRRSVEAHPPPPGSRGPNDFMLVARVCSCFISASRRPHLGSRARDECQPFPRTGRSLELSQAVRVLSYEQVTPLDRQWSTSRSTAPRLANLVVPYPSSLLGADASKGRAAPWAVDLAKPVRVFSAFGMLSNLTALSRSQLRANYALHCSPAEQRMIDASSCYGKRCRFALRALVLQQLDAARLAAHERHRERSCLREGKRCPAVMSLSFWAPHDGGEGYGKLSSHHASKHKEEPLYVDDREANDVLAVYRVMLSSTFCVHIGGDTPTRKSFIDAIMATCIPALRYRHPWRQRRHASSNSPCQGLTSQHGLADPCGLRRSAQAMPAPRDSGHAKACVPHGRNHFGSGSLCSRGHPQFPQSGV